MLFLDCYHLHYAAFVSVLDLPLKPIELQETVELSNTQELNRRINFNSIAMVLLSFTGSKSVVPTGYALSELGTC